MLIRTARGYQRVVLRHIHCEVVGDLEYHSLQGGLPDTLA